MAMLRLLDEVKAMLDREHKPDGYNIGVNNGVPPFTVLDPLVWVRFVKRDDLGTIRVVKRYLNVQGASSNAESQQQRAWRMPG